MPVSSASGRSSQVAGRVEQGMDQAVVAEVRPAMVHVEHGDVDHPRIGGGEVLRPLDAHVLESAAGGVAEMPKAAEVRVAGELVLAEKGHIQAGPDDTSDRIDSG